MAHLTARLRPRRNDTVCVGRRQSGFAWRPEGGESGRRDRPTLSASPRISSRLGGAELAVDSTGPGSLRSSAPRMTLPAIGKAGSVRAWGGEARESSDASPVLRRDASGQGRAAGGAGGGPAPPRRPPRPPPP